MSVLKLNKSSLSFLGIMATPPNLMHIAANCCRWPRQKISAKVHRSLFTLHQDPVVGHIPAHKLHTTDVFLVLRCTVGVTNLDSF